MKLLGSPIGTEAFIQSFTDMRLEEERRLWNAIPSVLDFQCAWQLLLQCAGLRSLPNQPGMQQDTTKGCSRPRRHCWAPFLAWR